MKRILSAILAMLMIVACASVVSAKEAVIEGTNEVAIAVDDVNVEDPSETIYVPVNIKFADNFGGIIGATVQLTYDTTKITFNKSKSTLNFAVTGDTARINENASKLISVQYVSADMENGRTNGTVFATLAFDAVAGSHGDALITVTNAKFSKVGNTACTNNVTNGKITLPKPKYNITIDGDAYNNIEMGTAIADIVDEPTKDGFVFAGWICDDEPVTTVTKADMVITSKWNKINKVTFDEGEGVTGTVDDTTGIVGDEIALPAGTGLSKEHYTFQGWKLNGEGDTLTGTYTLTSETDINFVADWKEDPKYTVTYATDKGTAPAPVTEYVGTEITLASMDNIEREDGVVTFTFGGWENGTLAAGAKYTITGDATLTAKWTETAKATVTFNNERTTEEKDPVTDYVGTKITLPVLAVDGTWANTAWTDGAGTYAAGSEYTLAADVTLTAIWAEYDRYVATFEEGAATAATAPADIVKFDSDKNGEETIVLPGIQAPEHFTFLGWNDELLQPGDEVTLTDKDNATVFVAMWEEDPKATVTYEDEIATAPDAVIDYVGEEIDVASPGEAAEEYYFIGWTDGTNTYEAGDKLTIDADGVTLTAEWGVKVTVNTNGAKGTAPVIGGKISDPPVTVTLSEFGTGTLTKVNHTFLGWSETENGEIITEYTIKATGNILYAIWEQSDEDAAIIETKVTYYPGNYLVDLYFYGQDANTVAFGYSYGENLTFLGFTPADGLSAIPKTLEDDRDGYYSFGVTDERTGVIKGTSATAGNGIHLGTISFAYSGDNYSKDEANDNVAITVPKKEVALVSGPDCFYYTPAVNDLDVSVDPIVFDEVFTFEIIETVYSVTGSVKVIRKDGIAPKNFANINVYSEAGLLIRTVPIESAETTTVDGVFDFEVELPEGNYEFVIEKTGYIDATVDVTVGQEDSVDLGLITLTPGDVVEVFGKIDLLDFAAIVSAFGRGNLPIDITVALDIDESGYVTIEDLNYIKQNYGAKA